MNYELLSDDVPTAILNILNSKLVLHYKHWMKFNIKCNTLHGFLINLIDESVDTK